MENGFYNELIKKYPIQKTLRWEIKPIGKTRSYLSERNMIETDEHMADSYKKIKKMIDRYHKKVIAESLENGQLSEDLLEKYYFLIRSGKYDEKISEKEIEKIESNLRKEVVAILSSHSQYKSLFGKEILNELPKIAETQEEFDVIQEFSKFTTLLQNYHEVRKNLYSTEEKSSTIAYRLIHENLPKFFMNINIYEKICCKEIDFSEVLADLEPELGEIDMGEVFCIRGFNQTLSQKGIDRYNQIIGGISNKDCKKKGLNEVINLWNQQHRKDKDFSKLPKFIPLYKQILSDKETNSFVIDVFETDIEVVETLKESFKLLEETVLQPKQGISVSKLYEGLSQHTYNLAEIFVKNDGSLTELSNLIFNSWNKLSSSIFIYYDKHYEGKKKKGSEKYEDEKEKELKKKKSYSIEELQNILSDLSKEEPLEKEEKIIVDCLKEKWNGLKEELEKAKKKLSETLEKNFWKEKPLNQNEKVSNEIKQYLDSVKQLQAFLGLLQGTKLEADRDGSFYGDFLTIWDSLLEFNSLYNKTRNYITKKPYSTEKIKLNFQAPTLLSGWDSNKEADNLGILLQKEGNYYLGIIDRNNRKIFKEVPEYTNGTYYEKIEYKQLPGPNKMLPKVFFSKSRIEEFAPSTEIMKIYKAGTFKKGNKFSLEDCHKLIDFFKASIEKHEDWKKFEFHFSPTESYHDISEFYKEVADQGYKITKKKVADNYIEQLVENGQLYLFQIYSKDFSEYSKGKLDLQTIYWKMLFDERNLKNVVYKLNGDAEIFYRKASLKLEDTAIHKANEEIKNKNPLNPKKKSKFEYDLVKNNRYTKEKFLFHVPITLNFISDNQSQMNDLVNAKIRGLEHFHVIGIDRGERNLLYAVVINEKGESVNREQISLNVIENSYYNKEEGKEILKKTDYHKLLDDRERDRTKARKDWTSIEQIKDLKNGYLSQAIHTIVEMAVKYNAFIVLEDLNSGFMRGRQKIEKQVYQNFEKMLIQKLNFLVMDKDRNLENVEVAGGALAAYQLTNKFESFNKLGKQSGILFYVPAWNTSKIDPTTGFVNLFQIRYETIEKTKQFLSKFDEIKYNADNDYFEFSFDYNNGFTSKAEGTRIKWTVCTYGKRLENFRNPEKNNEYDTKEYIPTIEFKKLLEKFNIEYNTGKDLKESILEKSEAEFFKTIMKILKMTLQMRNSRLRTDNIQEDYIQSCVMNKKGEFFNTSTALEGLPQDADANGAYNIARKGLMLIEKIKQSKENEKLKLTITNKEWLQYAQKNC